MKNSRKKCTDRKRKRRFANVGENGRSSSFKSQPSEPHNKCNSGDGLETENIVLPEVGQGDSRETFDQVSSSNNDHRKEFKVLGHTNFESLRKINVTPSWIAAATLFPAELHDGNMAELSSVPGLPEPIAALVRRRISSWFPVQKAVLPDLLKDISQVPVVRPRDIAISAPTGSGKTLCYVLPILTQVGTRPNGDLRALVIAPVQTLVKQIEQEFATYNGYGAVISALSGATNFAKEQRQLAPNGACISDVIISTPGRLMDHLTDPSSGIKLSSLRYLVVDEADRMGAMVRQEWLEVVERRSGSLVRCSSLADILVSRWAPRKILLSATLSKDVEELHIWNLHQPRFYRATALAESDVELKVQSLNHVSGPLSLPSCVRHMVLVVEQKYHPLVLYLKIMEHSWKKVLVFTNEKDSSLRLTILLSRLSRSVFTVENLTGDLFGNRRTKVLKRFKNGTTNVLICSDVLSRGVDVENVDCVVNYNLPKNDRQFVHRAGRTGRVGRTGHVLSLANGEARKIFVKNVLKKNGLWVNAQEEVLNAQVFEPYLARYEDALVYLKNALIAKGTIASSGKKEIASGFAYRKKCRYHAIKKRENIDKKTWKRERIDSNA